MSNEQSFNIIRSTVRSFLPGSKILLFGSRAKGHTNAESDYDLLIVTEDTFAPRIKMDWESKIRKTLIHLVKSPFDVILESESEIKIKKELKGHIVYYAMKDAIEI